MGQHWHKTSYSYNVFYLKHNLVVFWNNWNGRISNKSASSQCRWWLWFIYSVFTRRNMTLAGFLVELASTMRALNVVRVAAYWRRRKCLQITTFLVYFVSQLGIPDRRYKVLVIFFPIVWLRLIKNISITMSKLKNNRITGDL